MVASTAVTSERFLRPVVILTMLAIGIAVFAWLKDYPRIFRVASAENVNLMLVLAALGLGLNGHRAPPAFRVLMGYVTGSLTFYLITGYSLHNLKVGHPVADMVWVSVVFALLSMWRPSLALIPIIAVMWTKILAREDFGFAISSTDYMVVVELGVLLGIFILPASFLNIVATRGPKNREYMHQLVWDYLNAAVVIGAAVHLSNYFFSGHQKLVLENAGLLTWVLENPTYILTANTIDFSYLTVFDLPFLSDWTMRVLKWVTVPLNALVLIAQLSVVLALFSRRYMIAVTMFFDLMHLAIFALTAIFFWKWILLNLGMVHAFTRMRQTNWRIPLWLSFAALGVMFTSPQFFQVARLGWFDSGGVNHAHWQIETKDGDRIDVPTNFFLATSISFAQQRPTRPFDGFLPTHDWGTTMDADIMRRFTDSCAPTDKLDLRLDPEKLEKVGDFVRRHHNRVLERVGRSGNIVYDVYPHHIWSSPLRFLEFKNMDLSEVSSYILIVKAKCLRVDEKGAVHIENLARHETSFPLQ